MRYFACSIPVLLASFFSIESSLSENITLSFDASFTYWYAGEEGLPIAIGGVISTNEYFPINTGTLFQSSGYKPGFKLGLGIAGKQEWKVNTEYTWFHTSTNTTSAPLPNTDVGAAGTNLSGSPILDPINWFLQAPYGPVIASTWHLGVDLIDAVVSRPFTQDKILTVSPFGGLRTAFINQSIDITVTESLAFGFQTFTFSPPEPITSYNSSNSWAIGPRAGCDGLAFLPCNFRFEGTFGASLLYTQYTRVIHSENPVSPTYNTGPYTAFYKNYNCLRPELDLSLGFGWKGLVYNRSILDLSASYEFMLFWAQNMMRKLIDDVYGELSIPASELYLHGLTLAATFTF